MAKNISTISQNSRTPFLSWANRILYSTKKIQEQKNDVNLQCRNLRIQDNDAEEKTIK
jgi:hypothetical protein